MNWGFKLFTDLKISVASKSRWLWWIEVARDRDIQRYPCKHPNHRFITKIAIDKSIDKQIYFFSVYVPSHQFLTCNLYFATQKILSMCFLKFNSSSIEVLLHDFFQFWSRLGILINHKLKYVKEASHWKCDRNMD